MSDQRYTAQQVADAVLEAKGLVSVAARRLGCEPGTIRNYARRYKMVADAIYEAREALKDFAESRIYMRMDDGDTTALIFYLKTQAKDRGYVERQEVTGTDGGALQNEIIIRYADDYLADAAAVADAD